MLGSDFWGVLAFVLCIAFLLGAMVAFLIWWVL
jgi:hypothetical protein